MFPLRNHMSAQQPGLSFPELNGTRSWTIVNRHGTEYLTQRPGKPSQSQIGGEVMAGTGFYQSNGRGLDEVGVTDDDKTEHLVSSHISGVLPVTFGDSWGAEREGKRVKNLWTGIIAYSPDGNHMVGRLDPNTTGRIVHGSNNTGDQLQNPGEWISAGYHGTGMTLAWLSGVKLALTILGKQDVVAKAMPGRLPGKVSDWFPEQFELSLERLAAMNVSTLPV